MNEELAIPLFPLHTVLFPDGPLPLRIFETRYLDMVSSCLKGDSPFGVALISQGDEVGAAALTHEVGTLARIVDWHTRHDGLLGITCVGGRRFRILEQHSGPDRLVQARVELLPACREVPLPAEYLELADLLRGVIERIGRWYAELPTRYDDAAWVGNRLAELLPIRLAQKQYFLQLEDPVQRLERLAELMATLGEGGVAA